MHKQIKPNLRVNLEESMCVIMKGSKVSSGKAYWYYTTVDMLVYLEITNQMYLGKASLFRNYANARNFFEIRKNNFNFLKAIWGVKLHPQNNLFVGNCL